MACQPEIKDAIYPLTKTPRTVYNKNMENAIEIKNLKKSYGDTLAVDDLSFTVGKGELFAFLGVNGAGKSTAISIICGTLAKDCGEVFVCGENADENPASIAKKIGVVFQYSALDKTLSVRDNLLSRAALYGICGKNAEKRISALAEKLGFTDLLPKTLGKLSGGQRRKIDVARALVHNPGILILDEPTTGLDPQTRKTLWNFVSTLRKDENMTVFLTTHYMEEAADADRVIILNKGKIAAEGTPLELKNKYTGDFVTLYSVSEEDVKSLNLPFEKTIGGYRVEVKNTAAAKDLIISRPEIFGDFEITKGKMDDVFLAVTGIKAGENVQ